MIDITKRIDDMRKAKTLEQFIADARKVHGDKYDYSRAVYKGVNDEIEIICPIHGAFWKSPTHHLGGQGCKKCSHQKLSHERTNVPIKKLRRLIRGVGVFDADLSCTDKNILMASRVWRSMLARCYSTIYQKKEPTYIGCKVCDEWLKFSNFEKWFNENYIDGYALDKDILCKGNKIYSPQTCCFVPARINSLLLNSKARRGDYPRGVYKKKDRYRSEVNIDGKKKFVGSFKSIEDAFLAHKKAKESYIKDVANEYFNKGLITEKVYNALMNYKIEITD